MAASKNSAPNKPREPMAKLTLPTNTATSWRHDCRVDGAFRSRHYRSDEPRIVGTAPSHDLRTRAGKGCLRYRPGPRRCAPRRRRGRAARRRRGLSKPNSSARSCSKTRGARLRGGGVRWARPATYRWPRGGAIAAGAAIGVVTAATAAAWAGAAPAPGMCWYYTDPSRTQGFWDYCQ